MSRARRPLARRCLLALSLAALLVSVVVPDAHARVPRHTLLELRFQYVVRQESDYSCGAAALATLLTYYFHDRTSEEDVLELLQRGLSEEEAASRELTGYSLLELKGVAERMGYRAAGYRLTYEQLQLLAAPVIVHVVPLGYPHFAVLRGIVGDRVLLADPSRGNLRMSAHRFREEWSGVVFVLGADGEEWLRGRHVLRAPSERDRLVQRLRVHRQIDRANRLLDSLPALDLSEINTSLSP